MWGVGNECKGGPEGLPTLRLKCKRIPVQSFAKVKQACVVRSESGAGDNAAGERMGTTWGPAGSELGGGGLLGGFRGYTPARQ